ncbi:MAG: alpha/beta hydrolase, partial [Anaerolineae bacterium]
MTMTNAIPYGVRVLKDLRYGTAHARQALDLYLPPGSGPWPVIVWVHGGAFRLGSKEGPLPAEYLNEGFAIASLSYRLSQHAIWPAQTVDCKAGVRWLRAHAAEYGLDPGRFVAWGTSGGGHLSAMLGVSGHVRDWEQGAHLEHSSRVQAVVDWF